MNKKEFLEELRETLSFELPEAMVRSNVAYYASYIDGEVRKGRTHADVFEELGEPSLIARSIIDAAKSGADGIPYTEDDADYAAEIFGGETIDAESGRASARRDADVFGRNRQQSAFGRAAADGRSSESAAKETFDENGNAAGADETSGYTEGSQRHRDNGWMPFDVHIYHAGCFGCLVGLLVIMTVAWLIGGVLSLLSPIIVPICLVVLIIWLIKSISGRG